MQHVSRWLLPLLLSTFFACDDGDGEPGGADAQTADGAPMADMGPVEDAAVDQAIPEVDPQHAMICRLIDMAAGGYEGDLIPGAGGAPRWGIPAAPPATLRTRRSWSTLSDAEKRTFIDALIAMKQVTVDSGDPGSARAGYASFCDGEADHQKTLYDYYVEAHMSAFISLQSAHMSDAQLPHKGPHFLPWHRYLLLRFEADLAEIVGDPGFALPYWDWTDCHADGDPATCAPIFQADHLGTPGACEGEETAVSGYLMDQGFGTNLYNSEDAQAAFTVEGVVCGRRHLRRQVGCQDFATQAPDQAIIDGMFDRTTFDSVPYDGCYTDDAISFRQYLEGFDNRSTEFVCVGAGCGFHGLAHNYIGGDMMSNATPNDPMFFLHHAGVDRMWAAWQAANVARGAAADHGNPGYPDAWRTALFNWTAVDATEMFDHEGLGYTYDALPSP